MKRLQWLAGVLAAIGLIAVLVLSGVGGPNAAYSQVADSSIVTNTSGRALQVIDGVSGQPVYFGDGPWMIQPGQTFYSFPWQDSSRFFYGNRYYHYIGSVPGSRFQFFLVEDWQANSGQSTVPLQPPATPTPVATATPTTPYLHLSTSYLPNCGLTQVKGKIVNPDGIGRGGVHVRVSSGDWSAISNPSNSDGTWDVLLAGEPKAGVWQVQVWDNGGQSPVVTVETNTGDCGPNGNGRQVAVVDFKKHSY